MTPDKAPTRARAAHVALIRPPVVASHHSYSIRVVPPIGPAYLAGALEGAGHRVTVIDALGEAPFTRHPTTHPKLVAYGLDPREIASRIPADVDGIAISVMFSQQWPHVAEVLRAVHARHPSVPILMGGEHVTATWRFLLDNYPALDVCALGEGEDTIVELAEWLAGLRALESIQGIAYRKDGQPSANERRTRIRDVDRIARPAWHLFPLENYLANGLAHGDCRERSMPMLASRGCPYKCTFCSNPSMWTTKYYTRDVKDVVDEIEDYVGRYRISNVDFEDLTAILTRGWILDFCRELEARNLKITYQIPVGTRSEALDREVLAALARTGCSNLTYAPESGSKRSLKLIDKRINPKRMLESIRAAAALGMTLRANFVIGFPHETWRDLFATIAFGLKMSWAGVEDVALLPFVPYPGSQLFDQLRAVGRIPELNDDYFVSLTFTDMTVNRATGKLAAFEIRLAAMIGMASFYLLGYVRRPWALFRTLRNVLTGQSETALEKVLVDMVRRKQAGKRFSSIRDVARTHGDQAPIDAPPGSHSVDERARLSL